ncbi:hypothetical protein ACIRPT_39815 [Streptomyces sp. NPDC101227]|uniref:hypothetical protein n=1 Tax=Streptomyces sp. NPDC101227 TaxID=3366136 RepID=UPI0037FD425E
MSEHDGRPAAGAQPARDHRRAETVMKTILVVAALTGAIVLLPMIFVIAVFAMGN